MIMERLASEENPARFDVCGVGNAIVDLLANSDDAFLESQEIIKDSMNLIDEERAEALYKEMKDPVKDSGGSVANSMAAIASLGGKPCYVGKVRDDELGGEFIREMEELGVHTPIAPATEGPSTARCMIFVTPDASRSMCTYLGACVGLAAEDIDPMQIVNSKITFLEGYLFDPPRAKEAFRHCAKVAQEANRLVALSLSDLFCVDRHRDDFMTLIKESVDILICNEAEIKSLFETENFDEAVGQAAKIVKLVAVTCGEKGVIIACDGEVSSVPADPVEKLVDTTGAGDMFAGGFLYGLANGQSVEESGRIGVVAASNVLGHYGPRPKESLRELMKAKGIDI